MKKRDQKVGRIATGVVFLRRVTIERLVVLVLCMLLHGCSISSAACDDKIASAYIGISAARSKNQPDFDRIEAQKAELRTLLRECDWGVRDSVELLEIAPADEFSEVSALDLAAIANSAERVGQLLAEYEIHAAQDPDRYRDVVERAALYAVHYESFSAFELLLQSDAPIRLDREWSGESGYLHSASAFTEDGLKIVSSLMSQGLSPLRESARGVSAMEVALFSQDISAYQCMVAVSGIRLPLSRVEQVHQVVSSGESFESFERRINSPPGEGVSRYCAVAER